MSLRIVPQIVLSPIEGGVDFGGKRVVLAQQGNRRLWWCKGHMGWYQIGATKYYPAHLVLHDGGLGDELHEGGRLSRRTVLDHAAKIDEFFGLPGVAEMVATHLRETVMIGRSK